MHFYNQSIVTSKITFQNQQNVHLENIVLQVHFFFFYQIFIMHRHNMLLNFQVTMHSLVLQFTVIMCYTLFNNAFCIMNYEIDEHVNSKFDF